jgi:hypothetical protein
MNLQPGSRDGHTTETWSATNWGSFHRNGRHSEKWVASDCDGERQPLPGMQKHYFMKFIRCMATEQLLIA